MVYINILSYLILLYLLQLECQEYGTDSEDDYDGDIAEEDESLADKLKHVLDDHATDELEIDGEYKVPAPDVIRRCVEYAEKYENEKEDEEVVIVQESSDESEKWDCETIVSTYSNLDNHPAKIVAPGLARKKKLDETIFGALNAPNHVISLRGKEKLPVDFLPLSRKAATEKVKFAGVPKTEQQKRKQHGLESKEEKKERKVFVYDSRFLCIFLCMCHILECLWTFFLLVSRCLQNFKYCLRFILFIYVCLNVI